MLQKISLSIFLLFILIASISFIIPKYKHMTAMEDKNNSLKKLKKEKRNKQLELNKLVSDLENNPKIVEKIAREKFKLSKPNEIIFRYQK